MFEPIGGTRPLPYPLKDQVTNGNITDDLGLVPNDFVWPDDPEERTVLPLLLSQHEFTAILSAVDVGADIAYPLQYIEVYWLLVRNLRYKVPICDMIIDCITNNPATQQAIVNMLMNNNEYNNYLSQVAGRLTGPQIEGELVYGSCDESVLAGKVIAIVDRLAQNNVDALEVIEVGTNDEEKMAAFLEAIPIFGELPFGDAIDALQDTLEDFGENYDAANTFERRDELAEDLYCLARGKPDCVLTYGDLYNFFADRVGAALSIDTGATALYEWLTTGDFSDDQLVFDGMFFLQIASIRMGGVFFGINMPKIGSLARDALPSTRWEEWDECGEDDECSDFTASTDGWVRLIDEYGTYHPGEGWGRGTNPTRIGVMKDFSQTVVKITVTSNEPFEGMAFGQFAGYNDFSSETIGGTALAPNIYQAVGSWPNGVAWELIAGPISPTFRVVEVCVEFA